MSSSLYPQLDGLAELPLPHGLADRAGSLPAGWEPHRDAASGMLYYVHEGSGETRFESPTVAASPPSSAEAPTAPPSSYLEPHALEPPEPAAPESALAALPPPALPSEPELAALDPDLAAMARRIAATASAALFGTAAPSSSSSSATAGPAPPVRALVAHRVQQVARAVSAARVGPPACRLASHQAGGWARVGPPACRLQVRPPAAASDL